MPALLLATINVTFSYETNKNPFLDNRGRIYTIIEVTLHKTNGLLQGWLTNYEWDTIFSKNP
jgi:hypothetical protein